MSEDRSLSTDQVAKRIGLDGRAGQRQVVRLIEAGKLPAVNVSSGDQRPRWKVRESAVAEWIASHGAFSGGDEAEPKEKRPAGNFLRQERRERRRSG